MEKRKKIIQDTTESGGGKGIGLTIVKEYCVDLHAMHHMKD